jgi:hypothetical protein
MIRKMSGFESGPLELEFRRTMQESTCAKIGSRMQSEARNVLASLVRLAADGAHPARIADAAVAAWRDIEGALSPIIGPRGVAALYERSLYLTRADYPWLAAVYDDALKPDGFAALHKALLQQTSLDAAAANDVLLRNFCSILTNLIGASLTERLLGSAAANLTSGRPAQDTPS